MDDWIERYSTALEQLLGRPDPGLHLPRDAVNPLLTLAREVAHGTERKNAPLVSYVVGRYVAIREGQGADVDAALAEAREAAAAVLPAEG